MDNEQNHFVHCPLFIDHSEMDDFPKLLIVLGVSIALVGVIWLGASKVFGGVTLPGTIVFDVGGMTCIVPIVASIVLSIVLTILVQLAVYLSRR